MAARSLSCSLVGVDPSPHFHVVASASPCPSEPLDFGFLISLIVGFFFEGLGATSELSSMDGFLPVPSFGSSAALTPSWEAVQPQSPYPSTIGALYLSFVFPMHPWESKPPH